MVKKAYKNIVQFIAITIIVTISIQIYWNVIHYQANKAEFISQVNSSLNEGIERYYSEIARSHEFRMITSDSADSSKSAFKQVIKTSIDDEFPEYSDGNNINIILRDSVDFSGMSEVDSLIKKHRINELATKIFVSISNDSLELTKLSAILREKFAENNWPIQFGLINHDYTCYGDSSLVPCDSIRSYGIADIGNDYLSTLSRSAYLPENNSMEIRFTNVNELVFRRSLIGMILSLILSVAIIACLVFLLRIIRKQKQVAEIKNDLISNITHEFKTPITTISSALEAIENFNQQDDKEKTKKYMAMSKQQVEKLNLMVEKLLETATLDSDLLQIEKEACDLSGMIQRICDKQSIIAPDKKIEFNIDQGLNQVFIDPFHFENAISNIIDNAIKYGGDIIIIGAEKTKNGFKICISDNGTGIAKEQQILVFDKFYRVPKGNVHDVKGFGIGLYYSRKIIEKHGGAISLESKEGETRFTITMNDE